MSLVFIDTLYWIGLINPRDQYRALVLQASQQLQNHRVITTETVLLEVGNAFANAPAQLKGAAGRMVVNILENPKILVVYQSQALLQAGLNLYGSRLDKGYSLTDCISICVMKEQGIPEILTHDHHFTQEDFTILLASKG